MPSSTSTRIHTVVERVNKLLALKITTPEEYIIIENLSVRDKTRRERFLVATLVAIAWPTTCSNTHCS